jgi:hypothetical protein
MATVEHTLTHRHYRFSVMCCEAAESNAELSGRRWISLKGLDDFPLPRPHLRIAQMLRERGG